MEKNTKKEEKFNKREDDGVNFGNLEEEITEFKRLMLLQKIIEIRLSDPNYFI
ncbi:MAG: hypothetical protein ACTSWY_06070 [Promethearchaeota archaeon]